MVLTRKVLTFSPKFIPARERVRSVGLVMYSERVETTFRILVLFKQHFAPYPKKEKK